eukprot:scaffold143278_cov66-Phaeocystis_antarctica.AAC.3
MYGLEFSSRDIESRVVLKPGVLLRRAPGVLGNSPNDPCFCPPEFACFMHERRTTAGRRTADASRRDKE